MIKSGTKYRVLCDSTDYFNPGDIVVALEGCCVPYCCLLENYDPNKSIGDYNRKQVYALCASELEELDDDWTEE